jgi:glutamate synthase domain-containing protein 3
MIERHFKFTQSPVAENVIKNWESFLPKFIKVYPRDYRRVLEEAEGIKNSSNPIKAGH